MRYLLVISLISFLTLLPVYSQVEHLPVSHPVYEFLKHEEAKGLLPHFSSSSLPLQRHDVTDALRIIGEKRTQLSKAELNTLELFEMEFEIKPRQNAVVFYSPSDSIQILSGKMFSDYEKFFYRYKDSTTTVNVSPLASFDFIYSKNSTKSSNVLMGNLGVRFFGSLDNSFGWYLQATNGSIFRGDRALALEDNKLHQNVKFRDFKSDFDFTESHVSYQKDWFHAVVGRESRQIGSGLSEHLFLSENSPPMDAVTLSASFPNFEYSFIHGGLLAVNKDYTVGFNADIPAKYLVMHRFTLKPTWGEFAFWEAIVYSKRSVDFAYINPLCFLKSTEHSLHDRDNALMGGYITYRPFPGLQIKGSYLLDDIVFSKIGKNYWGNKSAWNISANYCLPNGTLPIDLGIEYARIEPFTFTQFDSLNSYTNDERLIGIALLPNSDELTAVLNFWYGGRYPLTIKLATQRHGDNFYDTTGKLINVGGDPWKTKTDTIPEKTVFLYGKRIDILRFQIETGFEIIRGFNLRLNYQMIKRDDILTHYARIIFRFADF